MRAGIAPFRDPSGERLPVRPRSLTGLEPTLRVPRCHRTGPGGLRATRRVHRSVPSSVCRPEPPPATEPVTVQRVAERERAGKSPSTGGPSFDAPTRALAPTWTPAPGLESALAAP